MKRQRAMDNSGISHGLILKIVTPRGTDKKIECDSINLSMAGGDKMKEGSIGIHHGHENAVIALKKGMCTARLSGKIVLEKELDGGFAVVKDNCVSVITDNN